MSNSYNNKREHVKSETHLKVTIWHKTDPYRNTLNRHLIQKTPL
ncbi:hypothetical protein LPICM17_350115 [Lactococcus piscium]|nr:hypothetical protein LPICM17_350115 [Lactococcus piscium]